MHEEFHKMPVAIKKVEEKMDKLRVADAITEVFTIFKRCNKYIDETLSQCDYGTLMNCYEKTDELIGTIQRVFDTITEPDETGEFDDRRSIFSRMADGELLILNACLRALRERRYNVHADGKFIGEFDGTETAELTEKLIEIYKQNTPEEERYYHAPEVICGQTVEDTLKTARKLGLIGRYSLEVIGNNGKVDMCHEIRRD